MKHLYSTSYETPRATRRRQRLEALAAAVIGLAFWFVVWIGLVVLG